jgi:hypothetical protein
MTAEKRDPRVNPKAGDRITGRDTEHFVTGIQKFQRCKVVYYEYREHGRGWQTAMPISLAKWRKRQAKREVLYVAK